MSNVIQAKNGVVYIIVSRWMLVETICVVLGNNLSDARLSNKIIGSDRRVSLRLWCRTSLKN